MYTLELAKSADKDLEKLDHPLRLRILRKINSLPLNPRPPGVTKLKGEQNQYRIRTGDYRIVYDIHDQKLRILVIRIQHRNDVYRQM